MPHVGQTRFVLGLILRKTPFQTDTHSNETWNEDFDILPDTMHCLTCHIHHIRVQRFQSHLISQYEQFSPYGFSFSGLVALKEN